MLDDCFCHLISAHAFELLCWVLGDWLLTLQNDQKDVDARWSMMNHCQAARPRAIRGWPLSSTQFLAGPSVLCGRGEALISCQRSKSWCGNGWLKTGPICFPAQRGRGKRAGEGCCMMLSSWVNYAPAGLKQVFFHIHCSVCVHVCGIWWLYYLMMLTIV